jgi:hypothetical protein
MDLTNNQKTTVLAYIQNNPTLNALYNDSVFTAVADALNATSSTFYVWKTSLHKDVIMMNGMNWTRVDNLSVGKARIWEWMFDNESKTINPSKANIRAGIDECWAGTGTDLVNLRASIYGHCKRIATVVEKMLATGTGTESTPATLTVEGEISYWDIQNLES